MGTNVLHIHFIESSGTSIVQVSCLKTNDFSRIMIKKYIIQ